MKIMSTTNAKAPPMAPVDQKSEDKQQFLIALYWARQERARALLPRLDWSLLTPDDNPLDRVFNRNAWTAMQPQQFLERNRGEVAFLALENFDFDGLEVVGRSGWEMSGNNGDSERWTRTVYLQADKDGEDNEADEKPSVPCTLILRFAAGSSAIQQMEASDASGRSFGGLHGFEAMHQASGYGCTREHMPALLLQVMDWCIDNGRSDLFSRQHETAPWVANAYHDRFLYRALLHGQSQAALKLLDHGCDPYEKFVVKEGGQVSPETSSRTLLEHIERDLGEESAQLVRSYLLRKEALGVVASLDNPAHETHINNKINAP